jgi:hypothetical protein
MSASNAILITNLSQLAIHVFPFLKEDVLPILLEVLYCISLYLSLPVGSHLVPFKYFPSLPYAINTLLFYHVSL